MTEETITTFVDHSLEWNTTGTLTRVEKFTEAASLLIPYSISTIFDKKIAVRVTNTTKSPYSIKKNKHIVEFSVVTPEQSKFIKPVDTAILSMIPEGDGDLTTYLTKLLTTIKLEQQKNNIWVPKPGNLGNIEDRTPIQTRILKKLHGLKEDDKVNPKTNVESRLENLERFGWADTLLTETEKQTVEYIIVEYHDTFARQRMDIGLNTDFKVELTPKDDNVA